MAKENKDYGNFNLPGLGPDAQTVTKESGGKQSHTPYRFDAIPPLALAKVAEILAHGAEKYGVNNWIQLADSREHVGRAMAHCTAFLAGDTQEGEPSEHLAHALCRLLFALDLLEREKQKKETLCSCSDDWKTRLVTIKQKYFDFTKSGFHHETACKQFRDDKESYNNYHKKEETK